MYREKTRLFCSLCFILNAQCREILLLDSWNIKIPFWKDPAVWMWSHFSDSLRMCVFYSSVFLLFICLWLDIQSDILKIKIYWNESVYIKQNNNYINWIIRWSFSTWGQISDQFTAFKIQTRLFFFFKSCFLNSVTCSKPRESNKATERIN